MVRLEIAKEIIIVMNFIGRETELNSLSQGLSPAGTMRAAFICGEGGIGKSALVGEIGKKLLNQDCSILWLCPRNPGNLSPAGWASQLARDLQAGSALSQDPINAFAQIIGRELAVLPHTIDSTLAIASEGIFSKVASILIKSLEKLMESSDDITFSPVFVFDDVDGYNPRLLNWIETDLNVALRESKYFKKARFLFTGQKPRTKLELFFQKFGFEQIHDFLLSGLSSNQTFELFKGHSSEKISAVEIYKKTRGNPSKVLKLASQRIILDKTKAAKMSENSTVIAKALKNLTEQDWSYLFRASYPDRINRYALEFFCPPREAAYCFNWIKRNSELADIALDGDVILKPEVREEVKNIHVEKNPAEAEEWEILSCVLNAFMGIFPNPNKHWIPVNLQLFNCFNRKLCKGIFDETSFEEIDAFLHEYQDFFTINDKQYKMLDDVKLITSRFVEIGGVQPREGLVDEIRVRWEEDQRVAEEQRVAMEQERINLVSEEEQAKKQIETLGELKDKLLDDYRKPKNFKSKKIYTVSTSPILIVLGVVTVGASLYADSIGSYYAAAGLLLTILGFFWPNIEVKKPTMGKNASGPNLAIETQQRSLDHRIVGLKNRVSSMTGSIQRISSELDEVNSGISEPYVIDEQT